MLFQPVPEGLHPTERIHPKADPEELQPWKGLMMKLLMTDCLPWEGLHDGAGKSVRRKAGWAFGSN